MRTKRKLILTAIFSLSTLMLSQLATASPETAFDLRVDDLNLHISQALNHGNITPPQADMLHRQINAVRDEEHKDLYDYGALSDVVAERLMTRLDTVSNNLKVFTGQYNVYTPVKLD